MGNVNKNLELSEEDKMEQDRKFASWMSGFKKGVEICEEIMTMFNDSDIDENYKIGIGSALKDFLEELPGVSFKEVCKSISPESDKNNDAGRPFKLLNEQGESIKEK